MTLNGTKVLSNKFGSLLRINLNSKLLIMSSSIIENEISKNVYYVAKSHMELKFHTKFHSNNLTLMMFAESQSHILTDNLTLTNNHRIGAINILRKSNPY